MRGRRQPDGIVEVERYVENFHHGLGNMSTVPFGSVTHNAAGNDGGYAELATGTASTDDVAELRIDNDYDPVAYDVIEFSVEFEASNDDQNKMRAEPINVYSQDGSLDDKVSYEAAINNFVTKRNGTRYQDDADGADASIRHTATIRWFTSRGVIQLYVDNQLRHEDTTSSEHPQTSEDYTIRALAKTKDTASDRLLRLYRYEVAYYIDRLHR